MARGVLGCLVFVAAFFSSTPAAAVETPSAPPVDSVQMVTPAVVDEIALLTALDAFHENDTIEFISDWARFDFFDRRETIDELLFVDDDNVVLLDFLAPEHKGSLSVAVRLTLGSLPDSTVERIEDGKIHFLDPQPWLNAAADLLIRRGLAPSNRFLHEDDTLIEVLEQVDTGDIDLNDWTDLSTAAPIPPGQGVVPESSATPDAEQPVGNTTDPGVAEPDAT
ncbi:MAG: hypothetical protein P8N02_11995, partial [Actinomycetota bacterium]|nr:hypothetical protein [Actinomycetota bacterium]